MTIGVVKIDLREGFSQALALLPYGAIGLGLREWAGKPVKDAEPHQRDQIVSAVERFGDTFVPNMKMRCRSS
jgi:hypothetical protein